MSTVVSKNILNGGSKVLFYNVQNVFLPIHTIKISSLFKNQLTVL